jgi:4-hydroxybenzoate polyprenyltransferase
MRLTEYIAYTRPRSVPITLAMAMTGWLASPARPREGARIVTDVTFLVVVHSILLWGGTNAFNSSEDRDEGPVNLLPDPPLRPPHLGAFGVTLMLVAVAGASLRGLNCLVLAALAVLLSIFYSWCGAPWRRGKELPGIDNLINAGGCGLGSFLFGWCTTGAPIAPSAVYFGVGWSVCLFGGMPTAQIFQLRPEESVSSARNWTSWLGAARTLQIGALMFGLHFLLLAPVSSFGIATVIWGTGVIAGMIHSAMWARSPFVAPYRRMLRQMTLLTCAQLAWAIGRT